MKVWINGQFVDRDKARLSVFDAGLQHAIGLFETMLARRGRIYRAADHMQRLINSARELQLTDRLRGEPLIEACELAVRTNQLEEARVRLTITGGDLNALQSRGQGRVDPTIIIVAQPATTYPQSHFDAGVSVVIADSRLNPLDQHAGHKTLNYWPRIRALGGAAARQAAEALWFTVSNHLASGSVSNVFLVKDDSLLTPIARGEEASGAMPMPILPGITRGAIIELADDLDIRVERSTLDIESLLGADEVFLTNSSWGVLPVVRVEREVIGSGTVGPVTRRLREAWLHSIDEESQRA
jgi:branched-subunit amino acid aminotransferase/4-amino-4-deoxychorismate lyase